MRIETAFSLRSPAPLVVVMLKPVSSWRHGKLKLVAVFLVTLLLLQYFFGASVYYVDYNIFQYYWSSAPTAVPKAKAAPAVVTNRTTASLTTRALDTFNDTGGAHRTTAAFVAVNRTEIVVVPSSVANVTKAPLPEWLDNVAPFTGQDPNLPQCPVVPPVLVGPIRVWFDYPSFGELRQLYPYLESGGHGKPKDCRSRHRVAVIIPYRDRERHLRGWLHNLHSLLTKQQLDYSIFVVEQVVNQTFNRAKLMNVGFAEANKLYDWQCFIFHDVDLLPEDDRNLYTCPEQPRHMSVAIDKFDYKLPYGSIFGGITALTKEQFEKMNGFSNDYWGWGGEDDDMSDRVGHAGFKISRYPVNIARYKMIKHGGHAENPINKCRYKLMYKTKSRWKKDGLSNLKYKALDVLENKLVVKVHVDLLETQSRKELHDQGFAGC